MQSELKSVVKSVGLTLALTQALPVAQANGIYKDGAGARAMSMGGASVADPADALSAAAMNPAGLAFMEAISFQIGGVGGLATGEFSNSVNNGADLDATFRGLPEAALVFPIKNDKFPIALGLSVTPDAVISGSWDYVDAPGLVGATYGLQEHRSEIVALRTALGAGIKIGESLSLGGSFGLVYNHNRLVAPYIFQRSPQLGAIGFQGFKTLLDLETDGFGFNGMFGAQYKLNDKISFGVTYQTETKLHSEGDASGNASAQLAAAGLGGAPSAFNYDAEVANKFPQMVTGGMAWKFHERARAIFQVDWIDWSDSFDDLGIKLTNGDNPAFNGLLGPVVTDSVPLSWKDRLVYRAGLEYDLTESWALRTGYSYGSNPVPSETLLPLTAAITEHNLGFGAGWHNERFSVDLAYQWSLPNEESVGASRLQAGEYSNATTEVSIHWVGVTFGMTF